MSHYITIISGGWRLLFDGICVVLVSYLALDEFIFCFIRMFTNELITYILLHSWA